MFAYLAQASIRLVFSIFTLLSALLLSSCSTHIGNLEPNTDRFEFLIETSTYNGADSSLPKVEFTSIVNRSREFVSGSVYWRDSQHLIANVRSTESDRATAKLIPIDGHQWQEFAADTNRSWSPDRKSSLIRQEGLWLFEYVDSQKSIEVKRPANDPRDFEPHHRKPVWSSDSRYVAWIENYRPPSQRIFEHRTLNDSVTIIDMDQHGPSPLSRWASRIVLIDRMNPERVQRFDRNDSAIDLAWSQQNTLFAVTVEYFSEHAATRVLRMEPASDEADEIYRTDGRFSGMRPAVHPNGEFIALVFNIDTRIWDEFQSIVLIDAQSGRELRRLTETLPILGSDYSWSKSGNEIYARVRRGGLDQIYAIPLEGSPRQLTSGQRRHFDISVSPDGSMLSYQTEDGYGRKDVRILDLTTGLENVPYTIDEPKKEYRLGEWQHARWNSTDGVSPYGFVFFPPDFDPTKKYPLIVDIHGGGPGSRLYLSAPFSIAVANGPLEWHAWAALGYVVFVPDYRSTGDYGPGPITSIYESGEIAAIKDIEDVVSGTERLVEQGFIDASRIGLIGHSAGGRRAYLTLTQHSHLYAAAVLNEAIAPDPISNFIGLASGRNAGGYPSGFLRQTYGGELLEVPERYKANYMLDIYRNKTPTLIMVGNETLGGVEHTPNEVMYSILKIHDVPTRMIKFVDEGHSFATPASADVAFEEARSWFERHMLLVKE